MAGSLVWPVGYVYRVLSVGVCELCVGIFSVCIQIRILAQVADSAFDCE